jgi:hypothetical protein
MCDLDWAHMWRLPSNNSHGREEHLQGGSNFVIIIMKKLK